VSNRIHHTSADVLVMNYFPIWDVE
jgi:hypothetical protein